MPDELRYAIRKELFLQPAQEAITMRNDISQVALPMRDYGSFLPGAGVGGAVTVIATLVSQVAPSFPQV